MSVTLEFVGGPLDGEVMAFHRKPYEWRVAFAPPLCVRPLSEYEASRPVPIREGVYRLAKFRREQSFRGGVQNNERRYIVDREVMRWMGER